MENNIIDFMHMYMYNLEQFLITKKDVLSTISFQSDEANTDRPLKEYLKVLIEKEFNRIPHNSDIVHLNIENKHQSLLSDLNDLYILKYYYLKKLLLK